MEDFLKKCSLFKDLSFEEFKKIKQIAYKKNYEKQEIIFFEGDNISHIHIIVSGFIKIFKMDQSGKEKTFTLLNKGDFFGEMSLFNEKCSSASAQAIEASQLILIEQKKFKKLIDEFPELAIKIIANLSTRLRKANQQIENLTFKNVENRLIDVLVDLKRAYGKKQDKGYLISKKITHQELANLVGTTRSTTTKILNKLADEDKLINKKGYLLLKENFNSDNF